MSDPTEPRRTWKHPSDPTFNPNRMRDLMSPEEHAAYRGRIMARRRDRRTHRTERIARMLANLRAAAFHQGPHQ